MTKTANQTAKDPDALALIGFQNVRKSFRTSEGGRFTALNNVSLSVNANEFFTLLGPSGCGKTTLLRLLAGFETPDAGSVTLDGKDITGDPANRRPVNTVFQSYALFPHMTIAQNIGFGLRMLGTPRDVIERVTKEMLDLVKLSAMSSRKPAQLSGGQQQRVALARALAPSPRVLLLDEPLSALDLKLRKEMQIEMKRIQRDSHTTFLFVTHDQEEALTMSDRIAVMDQGCVQQVGSPTEIYENPANAFVAAFIGDMNFVSVHQVVGREGDLVVADTPIGRLQARQSGDCASADTSSVATFAIRPERCRLKLADKKEAGNGVRAKITNVVFTGPFASVIVRPENSGEELRVRVAADNPDYGRFEVDADAVLELPSDKLMALAS